MEEEVKVPKFAIVPDEFKDEHSSLKAGDKFEVSNYEPEDDLLPAAFTIIRKNLEYRPLFCLVKRCAHLDGLDWILEY